MAYAPKGVSETSVAEEMCSRRSLLQAAGSLVPMALFPLPVFSRTSDVRQLRFYHTHTSEKLDIVYAHNGAYVPEALAEVNYLLRDFRNGEVHPIDPRLLDILHAVRLRTGGRGPFEVISAFRSQATNDALRHNSAGVARNSMHLKGRAIDVRLADVESRDVRRLAIAMRRGGVGYYPDSDFVHLDTGRVRTW
jgi:uncharacterized protein YcbK (DUF882 family)